MRFSLWIRNYLRHPMKVGAVFPSSGALGARMTSHIAGWKGGYVLELGPGTGVFTKALLQRGIPEEKLVLIEQSRSFAHALQLNYPKASVIQGDAVEIRKYLTALGIEQVEEVVSGIPLVSLGIATRKAICDESLSVLKEGGSFVQVTFFWRCPIPGDIVKKYSGVKKYCGVVIRNFPPAFVWRVSR